MKFLICSAFLLLAVSSMTNAECTTPDFAHSGNDILYGGHYNVKDSWEQCQLSCQAITDCTHWTWFSPAAEGPSDNYCLLKTQAGGLPIQGAISGPRFC